MKKFKSIILSFAILLAACMASWSSMPSLKTDHALADVLPSTAFEYVTFSQNGQRLNSNNLTNYENQTYIVANDSITMNFKPLTNLYTNLTENSYFYPLKEDVVIELSANPLEHSAFEYYGNTYYVDVNGNNASFFSIISGGVPFMTTENNSLISVKNQNETTVTLSITKSITWRDDAPSTTFTFSARGSIYQSLNTYTINFNRPVINFGNATNPAFMFETTSTKFEGTSVDSLLSSEQEFSTVKMDFLSNNYTRINPLWFNINFNGFTYNFQLYYETIESRELLFVNYIDSSKPTNNAYLATKLDSNQNVTEAIEKNNNDFHLLFNKTGRYEIEVYDSTYTLNLKNSNYYKTSFYIKSQNVSAFENIYMIAQTYDNPENLLSYIVNDSTQNHSVQITVKNLMNLVDGSGNPLELIDVIDKIEILKTIYGASDNEHVSTNYSVSEILRMISKETGDLTFNFEEDADYDIIIYDKNSNAEISYSFTIAKKAKTHYTPSGESEHRANILYHTEILNYTYNIDSTLSLSYGFGENAEISSNLNKNYINHYSISYGMEQVAIERVEDTAKDENNQEKSKQDLILRFMGVGDLIVNVTFDGVTTTYNLNYEQGNSTLTFTEYGTYSISMVDSMGTTTSTVISYKQPTNVSTIVLIVLSAVIVAVVLFFILRARAKVKTR